MSKTFPETLLSCTRVQICTILPLTAKQQKDALTVCFTCTLKLSFKNSKILNYPCFVRKQKKNILTFVIMAVI